ncbi:phage minor head protein [Litorimonas haliclonae]|uniref:phage minor head protein n=1 Tax=Litorimonas haliclonae TaxID=2081977 RepID=UPI0039EF32ED
MRRKKRDKRFDRTVLKAIRSGKGLKQTEIDKIAGRYSDRLLKLRADTIARTETLQALQASKYETYRQAIASGEVEAQAVTKRWRDSRDGRVRFSHSALHDEEIGFGEAFITPLGSMLRFPGDTSLGAKTADIVQCRCISEYDIDFTRGLE